MQSFPCHQRLDLVIDTQRFQLLLRRFSVSTSRKVYQDYCRVAEPCPQTSSLLHAHFNRSSSSGCRGAFEPPPLLIARRQRSYAKLPNSVVFFPFSKPAGRSPPKGNLLRCARACRSFRRQSYHGVLSDVALLLHHIVDQTLIMSKQSVSNSSITSRDHAPLTFCAFAQLGLPGGSYTCLWAICKTGQGQHVCSRVASLEKCVLWSDVLFCMQVFTPSITQTRFVYHTLLKALSNILPIPRL